MLTPNLSLPNIPLVVSDGLAEGTGDAQGISHRGHRSMRPKSFMASIESPCEDPLDEPVWSRNEIVLEKQSTGSLYKKHLAE